MAISKDYPNTDWATATETTVEPRIIYPFKNFGDTSGYIVERDYVQARDSYSPMALDTTDATFTSAYLFEETIPAPTSPQTLVTFTRRFGTVPSNFTTQQFETYSFPGYYASWESGGWTFRPPLSKLTPIVVTNSFMQTDDPETDFTITGTEFLIEDYYNQYVDYVDDYSSPTYTTYAGWVSASTRIQTKPNEIVRAYGSGNIWRQMRFQAEAQ